MLAGGRLHRALWLHLSQLRALPQSPQYGHNEGDITASACHAASQASGNPYFQPSRAGIKCLSGDKSKSQAFVKIKACASNWL